MLVGGVNYAPGALFLPDKEDSSYLRLNFSIPTPEKIEEGIHRLSRAVERYLELQPKNGRNIKTKP